MSTALTRDLHADVAATASPPIGVGVAAVAALGLAALGLRVAGEDLDVPPSPRHLDVAVAVLRVAAVGVAAAPPVAVARAARGLVAALRRARRRCPG